MQRDPIGERVSKENPGGRYRHSDRYSVRVTDLKPSQYADIARVLRPMGVKIEQLIREIMTAAGVKILDVTHRVKEQGSAVTKITESNGKYNTYADLHDMLGARVITYLEGDVERAVNALRSEFVVDETRSVDKQAVMDPDRFGYVSYHLVVKINEHRASLVEWTAFRDIYFEIQVRSILQHAWASIEHDLGYKPAAGLPADQKRAFARIAGLLETADREFNEVSRDVARRTREVDREIQEGRNLSVDRDSILALIASAEIIERADYAIAEGIGAIVDAESSPLYASARADELRAVGYTTTDAVLEAVETNYNGLVRFATGWFQRPEPPGFADDEAQALNRDGVRVWRLLPPGVSLFYLFIHAALEQPGGEENLVNIRQLDYPGMMTELRQAHREAFGENDASR